MTTLSPLQPNVLRPREDVVVDVKGLGKRYRIGARPGSGGLYDSVGRLFRPGRPSGEEATPVVWALRDVDFTLGPGHVMGVIGRNGSGKSTLLRILARVTAPTTGTAMVRGRVGALLQVGTGFHPELSGRDNIELAGAILGMNKAEVGTVFEQIVDFSEIGRFLDTAVKHYSSGMFMRLAFSVAAHLAAEVLLVDEALSVGDAAFQRKCHDRILSLVGNGRTVLFVSHSAESVLQLCETALVLDRGRARYHGPAAEALDFYDREVLGA